MALCEEWTKVTLPEGDYGSRTKEDKRFERDGQKTAIEKVVGGAGRNTRALEGWGGEDRLRYVHRLKSKTGKLIRCGGGK